MDSNDMQSIRIRISDVTVVRYRLEISKRWLAELLGLT